MDLKYLHNLVKQSMNYETMIKEKIITVENKRFDDKRARKF